MPFPKFVPVTALAGFLFSGCLPNYYPGITGAHVPGMITLPPPESDAPAHARYLSADGGSVMPFNSGESNTVFRGRYIIVRSGRHHTVNYGLFAYGGSYAVKRVPKYNGEYTYFGPGFEFSGEIHQPFGRVDAGIGTSWVGAVEFGDYRAFRKRSDHEGLAENNVSAGAIAISLFPLIRYRASDRTSVTLQCALGLPGLISPVVAVQHGDVAFWSCWLPRSIDDPDREGSIFSIGIGHKIP